jgi:ABC-type Mn2+/Zn2+ transport system permease subunit
MLEPFQLAFVQRGLLEILLLATAAGLLGTWIVMRGLAFFTHAVGTAAFPGLVVADGLAFSPHAGAAVAAGAFALGVERFARRSRATYDTLTALVLVAALATGVVLASDVFRSGGNVDSLLFGSLLAVGRTDLVLAAAVSIATVALTATAGPRLLAVGFDPGAAHAMGVRSRTADAALLVLVAATVIASLSAVGALLQTAILVVPAATVRLWTARLGRWRAGSIALAAAEGVAGLWLAVRINTPPGATIATVAGAVFAGSAVARRLAGGA